MPRRLPDEITREHVLQSIELFRGGVDHSFGPSTFYDLVYEGSTYPPKAIAGIAAALVTGDEWYPADFTGGEDSRCFAILRQKGFVIAPKGTGISNAPVVSGDREFGDIDGFAVGAVFPSRQALHDAGLHAPLMAGISGDGDFGAESIVLSGGYEDDEDHGDTIIYTGHGGQKSGKQVADQELSRGNAGLAKSCLLGLPVRVIRGAQHRSPHSPQTGYRYDGLYLVRDYWNERGHSGFLVWRFRLEKQRFVDDGELPLPVPDAPRPTPEGSLIPRRSQVTTVRVIRDTNVSRYVKSLYENTCQICGTQLSVPGGTYSEGAHIRALGAPHLGPDVISNVLCLCPNHHLLFDRGSIRIRDDLSLIGLAGTLFVRPDHLIDMDCLRYHREHHEYH